MKLYELARMIYLDYGNKPIVNLKVETEEIAYKFGSDYQGNHINFGGLSGHVNDIPAYLGGFEVLSFKCMEILDKHGYEITI